MLTRAQYLAAANGPEAHREYYGQFVTTQTRDHIRRAFTPGVLRTALAADHHLNSISLDIWDRLTWAPVEGNRYSRQSAAGNSGGRFYTVLPFKRDVLDATGEGFVTRAFLVCVAKEAATQIADGELDIVNELLAA